MGQKMRTVLLLIGDISVFYLALILTLLMRYQERFDAYYLNLHLTPFTVVFILWIVILYIFNFYDLKKSKNDQEFYLSLFSVMAASGLLSIAFFYLLPGVGIAPKTNLIVDVILTTLLLSAWRYVFNVIIKAPAKKIAFVGFNEEVKNLYGHIAQNPQWGFEIKALVLPESKKHPDLPTRIYRGYNLLLPLKQHHISHLIVTDDLYQTSDLTESLYNMLAHKVNVATLSEFYEHVTKKVPLNIINKIWFLQNLSEGEKSVTDKMKRAFDIVFSIIILVIALPLLALLALLIKGDGRGPILYSQKRIGRLGQEFTIWKLRTMIHNAEKNGAVWAKKNDPRITRVGRFLRRVRLDELPQLINILKGDMSFVGPRAERPEFTAKLEKKIPFYKQRLLIKPGLTGWSQINFPYGASVQDAREKLQYDLYYIKHRSLLLDFSIILKTVRIVLSAAGQ